MVVVVVSTKSPIECSPYRINRVAAYLANTVSVVRIRSTLRALIDGKGEQSERVRVPDGVHDSSQRPASSDFAVAVHPTFSSALAAPPSPFTFDAVIPLKKSSCRSSPHGRPPDEEAERRRSWRFWAAVALSVVGLLCIVTVDFGRADAQMTVDEKMSLDAGDSLEKAT